MPAARNSYLPRPNNRQYDFAYASLVAALTRDEAAEKRLYARHPFLSALLVLLIVLNSFIVSVNLAVLMDVHGAQKLEQVYPNLPTWIVPSATILAAFNVAWIIAIMLGKRWGFYGFLATSVAMACVQSAALDLPIHAIASRLGYCSVTLLWPLLLLFLLRRGGPRSVWSHFE